MRSWWMIRKFKLEAEAVIEKLGLGESVSQDQR